MPNVNALLRCVFLYRKIRRRTPFLKDFLLTKGYQSAYPTTARLRRRRLHARLTRQVATKMLKRDQKAPRINLSRRERPLRFWAAKNVRKWSRKRIHQKRS